MNLGLAMRIKAPCILVADIDRGGVFASVSGTFQLLDPEESVLVRTFLINRFRGDVTLFRDGVRILEERTAGAVLAYFLLRTTSIWILKTASLWTSITSLSE